MSKQGRGQDEKFRLKRVEDEHSIQSVIAAFSKTHLLAQKCRVGAMPLSLAVDTGATINEMSENSFRSLRRTFRGGRCTLLPNDLNVVGLSGSNLEILGKIALRVNPGM